MKPRLDTGLPLADASMEINDWDGDFKIYNMNVLESGIH